MGRVGKSMQVASRQASKQASKKEREGRGERGRGGGKRQKTTASIVRYGIRKENKISYLTLPDSASSSKPHYSCHSRSSQTNSLKPRGGRKGGREPRMQPPSED